MELGRAPDRRDRVHDLLAVLEVAIQVESEPLERAMAHLQARPKTG